MVALRVKSGLFMGFGGAFVVLGAVLVAYWDSIFMVQLRRMMILSPTSMSFNLWRELPIPMYLECFLFNISNVDEILAGKNVPINVVQMGPYVFRETHTKVNITWNHNSTVTFYNKRMWHFQPEMSNGSLSDIVTSINPVVATVSYVMRYQRVAYNIFVDSFLRMFHDNMFLSANVSQWLFDGIDDRVLDIATKIPFITINIPYDKFGWFYTRNGSLEYDGIFLMNTGASDFSQLGNVEKWQYSNRTMYRGECGEVRGSTGELWAPELGQPEVTVFVPDICTYMILAKDKPVTVQNIEGVQYAANSSLFDNGYNYPHTACYCALNRDRNCLPPGALNVSSCRYGAPAFVTLPHMLDSDPYYPSKIRGLHPLPEHNFRLALEMFTGMPLSVTAQLQINLLVRHVAGITINNQLPDGDTLVPMFWFRQELEMTSEYARAARMALNLHKWMPIALYVLTGIGVVLLLWGVIILTRNMLRSPDTTPILEDSSSSETVQQ